MKQIYLYKYRAIENLDRDLATIASDTFFAAGIKNLNDDQECFIDGQLFIDSLRLLIEACPEIESSIENVKKYFDNIVSCREKAGVFSLSKDPCVGMMWALYASERKGYCVVYDKEALMKAHSTIFHNDRIMIDVEYAENVPRPNINDITAKKLPQKIFGTKDCSWAAEKEVRIITDRYGIQGLVPSALHGIIFGSDMNENDKQKIKEVLRNRNISFYQLQRKKHDYGYDYVLDERFEIPSDLDETTYLDPIKVECGITDNFFVKLTVTPPSKEWLVGFLKNFKKKYADGNRQCNIWVFNKSAKKEHMNIQNEHFADNLLAEWIIGLKEEELADFVKL